MRRLRLGVVILVIAIVASSFVVLAHPFGAASYHQETPYLSDQTVNVSTSTSTTSSVCVSVGEPFFPTTKQLTIDQFANSIPKSYQVSVNTSASVVVITNPGGSIGSLAVSTVKVPIVNC